MECFLSKMSWRIDEIILHNLLMLFVVQKLIKIERYAFLLSMSEVWWISRYWTFCLARDDSMAIMFGWVFQGQISLLG